MRISRRKLELNCIVFETQHRSRQKYKLREIKKLTQYFTSIVKFYITP